jgi:ubiquinone/menaquinone biosynthesis C-methylase UbiE
MNADLKSAAKLHEKVPPNWYYHSLRHNLGQKIWHERRFAEVSKVMGPVDGMILDIGCADGVFSKVILDKTHAKKVIGIDVLQDSVLWAKKHWKRNKKLSFRLGNAHSLKFPNNSFDAVFALEVLEHVSEPQKVFKEIKRVLTKDGYAVFLVPSDTTLFKVIWFFWTKFWRGKIWQDCHIQSFSKDNSLADFAKKQGFKVDVDKKFLLGMLNVVKVKKK